MPDEAVGITVSLLVGRPEPLDEHLVAGLDVRMKDVRIGDAEADAADGLHFVAAEQLDEVDDRLVAVAARREAVQLVSDEAPPINEEGVVAELGLGALPTDEETGLRVVRCEVRRPLLRTLGLQPFAMEGVEQWAVDFVAEEGEPLGRQRDAALEVVGADRAEVEVDAGLQG